MKFKVTIIFFLISLLLTLCFWHVILNFKHTDISKSNTSKSSTIKKSNEENLESHLIKITDNIRNFGSIGSETSAKYIKKSLEEYGYEVDFEQFNIFKQDFKSTLSTKTAKEYFNFNPYNSEMLGVGKNIIAKNKNYNSKNKTIYITAHYDTTNKTTGVIDNGTGVASVLTIAELLKDFDSPINIVYVLFDAEEYFRVGSRNFASKLNHKDVIGAINIDMIGEINGDNIVIQTSNGMNNLLSNSFVKFSGKTFEVCHGGTSDDLSFYLKQIPAITFANKNSNYLLDKESKDIQLQNIEFSEIKKIVDLIVSYLVYFDDNNFYSDLKLKSLDESEQNNFPNKVNTYKFQKKYTEFLGTGYDIKETYIYSNNQKTFSIIKESNKFINEIELSSFNNLKSNINYYYKLLNNKFVFINSTGFFTIEGNLNQNELLSIFKIYYDSDYQKLYGETPDINVINEIIQ